MDWQTQYEELKAKYEQLQKEKDAYGKANILLINRCDSLKTALRKERESK